MKHSPAYSHSHGTTRSDEAFGRSAVPAGGGATETWRSPCPRSRRKPRLRPAGVILLTLVAGCSFHTGPDPVTPEPPSPDGPGDCSTATANLVELGCEEAKGFEQNCLDAQAAEAKLGIAYPVGCLTAAKSCEAARACR